MVQQTQNNGCCSTPLSGNAIAPKSSIHIGNIQNLSYRYHIPTTLPVSAKPIVYQDHVYFTDWSGTAYAACASNGRLQWRRQLYQTSGDTSNPTDVLQGFVSTGVICGDCWYLASLGGQATSNAQHDAGRLYALNRHTGNIHWVKDLTTYPWGGSVCAILAAKGLIYVGLTSLDLNTNILQQPVANQGVGAILAFSQQNGNLVWRNEVSTGSLDTAAIISPFALDSSYNTLYAGVSKVDGSANATIALHAQTGETLWQQPLNGGSSFFAAGGPTLFSLQGSDCRIAAVGRGNADGSYSCHNRRNGNLIWQTQVSERNEAGYFGISTTASIKGERLYIYSNNDWLYQSGQQPAAHPISVACLDIHTGSILWRNTKQSAASGSATLANNILLLGDLDGTLNGYNAYTGDILYSDTVENASILSDITAAGRYVFFGAGPSTITTTANTSGLYAYALYEK